jgi:hypothetical protein
MADINSRLERLSRRDELINRARQRSAPDWVTSVGADVMEVVEAVAAVVRRHPGMSVMLAPADGRPGSAVIRVSERNGEVEVAPVNVPVGPAPVPPDPRAEPAEIVSAPTTVLPVSVPTPVAAGAPAGPVDGGYERTQPQPVYAPPPGYAPEPYPRVQPARYGQATDPRLPSGPVPGQSGPPSVPGPPSGPMSGPVPGPPSGPMSGPTPARQRPSQHAYPDGGPYPPYVPGEAGYDDAYPAEPPTQYVEAQPYDPDYPDGAAPDGERQRGGWRQPAPDQPPFYTPVENWQWER